MKKKILFVSLICLSLSFMASDCNDDDLVLPGEDPPNKNEFWGITLYTSNAGASWTEKNINTSPVTTDNVQALGCFSYDLSTITVISNSNNGVVRTTDYGDSWTPNNFSNDYKYAFTSAGIENKGYMITGLSIFTTTDNGSTWSQTLPHLHLAPLYAIDFCDEMRGFIISGNPTDSTAITTNGGATWEERLPIPGGNYNNSINFVSSYPGTEAVVCGHSCRIFRTSDLGSTWNDVSYTAYNNNLYSVDFIDPVGIIVGDGGIILRSHNRGLFWTDVTPGGATHNLKKVFLEGSFYWAVGDNVILRSSNQGQTWETVRYNANEYYSDLFFIKSGGVVVGSKRIN